MRTRIGFDISLTGLIYICMMMFMGLAAVNTQANLLFAVFGLMVGVLLISGVLSRVVLRRLEVTRDNPEHAIVGRPMRFKYVVRNRKGLWPSLSVTMSELDGVECFLRQPHAYLLHAAAGMKVTVPTDVTPKRRGICQLQRYQLSTSFPFGFIKRAVVRSHQDTLLVYPALGTVDRRLFMLLKSAQDVGSRNRPEPGGSDEFFGVREYRVGENPRNIYWKRSARTGVLVSREMTRVSPPRVLLMVNTFGETAAVEKAISIAATIADAGEASGLPVGLIAWNRKGWLMVAPSRGQRHHRDLLTALALLPANTEHNESDLLDAASAQFRAGTSPVLITPGEGDGGDSRGGVLRLSVADPRTLRLVTLDNSVNYLNCCPIEQWEDTPRPRRWRRQRAAELQPA